MAKTYCRIWLNVGRSSGPGNRSFLHRPQLNKRRYPLLAYFRHRNRVILPCTDQRGPKDGPGNLFRHDVFFNWQSDFDTLSASSRSTLPLLKKPAYLDDRMNNWVGPWHRCTVDLLVLKGNLNFIRRSFVRLEFSHLPLAKLQFRKWRMSFMFKVLLSSDVYRFYHFQHNFLPASRWSILWSRDPISSDGCLEFREGSSTMINWLT